MSCLQYRRRLNVMAQPDSNGVPCKVCLSCYENRGLSLGCTRRSHTELFQKLRKEAREEMMDIVFGYAVVSRRLSEQPTFWKEQFKVDIVKECQRLLEGFKSTMSGSGTMNTLLEIKDHMNVPSWQKSTFWTLESHTSRCRHCGGKLGHRKKMRNCRVCGLALCKACSQKELLLYFEDGKRHSKTGDAHLSIIRYDGCPDTEPQCSVLLYCCKDCKEEIIRRQLENVTWYIEKSKPPDLQSEIVRLNKEFRPLVEDIREDMEKLCSEVEEPCEITNYETIDEVLVTEPRRQVCTTPGTKFEIIKNRVNESLSVYWNLYSEMRSVIKENSDKLTGRMFDFVMNYATARKDFYIENETKFVKISREHEILKT